MLKIIIIVIVLIFFLYSKNVVSESFSNKTNILFIENKTEIKKNLYPYVKNINKYQVSNKTNFQLNENSSLNEILNFYTMSIKKFTDYEKYMVTKYTKIIDKYIHPGSLLHTFDWKFVKLDRSIEYGMPFTSGKLIFFSSIFLNDLDNIEKCLEIILHEKIHICQRYHQSIFDRFYKDSLNISMKKIPICEYWEKLNFTNPDGISLKYIYKDTSGKEYLPMLIQKRKLQKILIPIYNNKLLKTYYNITDVPINFFKYLPKDVCLYHPNEVTASLLPKIILKKKIHPFVIQMFSSINKYI